MVVISENIENDQQNKKKIKRIIIISFFFLILTSIIVILLLEQSGYAGTMDDTQLGFNGEIIKKYFALMSTNELNLFLLANLVDFLFMISYGLLFFTSAKFLSWDYQKTPHQIGTVFAWIGAFAVLFDAIENMFLLIMIQNPTNFPTWLAIGHSSFASLKFLCMSLTVIWLLTSLMLNKIPLTSKIVMKTSSNVS